MFDQMKALGALAGLMKNKDRLKELADEFRSKVERISVEGEAGSGAVRVTVSGRMRVTGVHVDPAAIVGMQASDVGRDMVESLIQEATNQGLERAQALIHEEARRMAQDLDLPDLPGMERLLGGM
jgi:DNA-binding YbaB/EbfC family protein